MNYIKDMGFSEDVVEIFIKYRDTVHDGNSSSAARELGVSPTLFWKWVNGVDIPTLTKAAPALDKIGAKVSAPSLHIGSSSLKNDFADKEQLLARIAELEKENAKLHEFEIKWKAFLELEAVRSGAPTPPLEQAG